jgi:hypothetical protein
MKEYAAIDERELAREVEVNGECLPHHKSHMI